MCTFTHKAWHSWVKVCWCVFNFSYQSGQRARLFFSFTPMRNCKASSSFDTQEAQLTICSFFSPALFDRSSVIVLHHRRSHNSTPELYRLWKMYIRPQPGSPLRFFLYGEKLLVRREYLKFDWIFSNIEIITHSQCENKCWEILFFCLFGIKVLSINKKWRNLKLIGVVIFCMLCPQVGRKRHAAFLATSCLTLWCRNTSCKSPYYYVPEGSGGGESGLWLSLMLCPFIVSSPRCSSSSHQQLFHHVRLMSPCWTTVGFFF